MKSSKQKTKQPDVRSNQMEIRDFTEDAYDYIWSKQEFVTEGVTEKFIEGYALRKFSKEVKDTHFTEYIGKAVRISQFLLRNYCGSLFEFASPDKSSFKKEVKLMWSHWLDNRNNVFVKVIDTLAIVAEAFLFCDKYRTTNLEISEMSEWFIEWFREKLALEFFKCGGWEPLKEIAFEVYDQLFENLQPHMFLYYDPKPSEDEKAFHSCQVTKLLRASPVKFPIQEDMLCKKCTIVTDKNLYRRTVYVRLASEFKDKSSLSESDIKQNPIIPGEENAEPIFKNEYFPEKNEPKEELIQVDCSTIIAAEQKFEVHQDSLSEISNEHLSSVLSNTISYTKDHFTRKEKSEPKEELTQVDCSTIIAAEQKFEVHQDSMSEISNEQLSSVLSNTISYTKDNCTNREGIKNTDNITQEDFSETNSKELQTSKLSPYLKTRLSTEEEQKLKEQNAHKLSTRSLSDTFTEHCITPQSEKITTQEKNSADAEIFSRNYSVDFKQNSTDATSSQEQPTISKAACNSSTISSSTEYLRHTEKSLSTEDLYPSQELLHSEYIEKTLTEKYDNPDGIRTLHFDEGINYNEFVKRLRQQVISQDGQTDGSKTQNKVYLISEQFSNSFKKMFKAYCSDPEEEKVRNVNMSEKSMQSLPEDLKSNQKSSNRLSHLEVLTNEYRYYFIGEEETNDWWKKYWGKT